MFFAAQYLNSLFGVDIPLVLMNSFKTHEMTLKLIRKYQSHNISIHTFTQVSDSRLVVRFFEVVIHQTFGRSICPPRYKWNFAELFPQNIERHSTSSSGAPI